MRFFSRSFFSLGAKRKKPAQERKGPRCGTNADTVFLFRFGIALYPRRASRSAARSVEYGIGYIVHGCSRECGNWVVTSHISVNADICTCGSRRRGSSRFDRPPSACSAGRAARMQCLSYPGRNTVLTYGFSGKRFFFLLRNLSFWGDCQKERSQKKRVTSVNSRGRSYMGQPQHTECIHYSESHVKSDKNRPRYD